MVEDLVAIIVNWGPGTPKSAVNLSSGDGRAGENSAISLVGHREVHRDSIVRGTQQMAAVTCYSASRLNVLSKKPHQGKGRKKERKKNKPMQRFLTCGDQKPSAPQSLVG